MGYGPSAAQLAAWRTENSLLTQTLRACTVARPAATGWGIAFEFELPLEGGRRPDVVILAGDTITVLEFKSTAAPEQAHIDQVAAYARDLSDYHLASHHRPMVPFLVLPGARETAAASGEVRVTDGSDLIQELLRVAGDGSVDLDEWLEAPYAPLPTLVEAARLIFEHQPLPKVKRAQANTEAALTQLDEIIASAAGNHGRVLVFLTGTPGSGKTLVGLQLVYQRTTSKSLATFLSGNGPLVKVLQDVLHNKAFVRDLHSFIRDYGIKGRQPNHHILVFDEAQRAWDQGFMQWKRGVSRSEPELLIDIGGRMPDWGALVGLVGTGQEIFSGEEGGLGQWRSALLESPDTTWTVHGPPPVAKALDPVTVEVHEDLDLTVSLRSHRAERVHLWVATLLESQPAGLRTAAELAMQIQAEGFTMYITRDLDEARTYARSRFAGEPEARFGLVASSHCDLRAYGVQNGYLDTRKVKEARWFNDPPESPDSCCALAQPLTEFGCQGLELDMPIVCWGPDYAWTGRDWKLKPKRRRYPLRDPEAILRNTYRVLLTRGREGFVIFLPDEESLDLTEVALLAAGVRPLPETLESYAA